MHALSPARDVYAIFASYAAAYAEACMRGDIMKPELRSAGEKVRVLAEIILDEPVASDRDLLRSLQVVAFFSSERPWMVKNPIELDMSRTPYLQVLAHLARLPSTNFPVDK